MTVLLLRHAPTPGNERGAYLGVTDEGLDIRGIALARRQAGRLRLRWPDGPAAREVITTPLLRTGETARLLFPIAVQHPVAGLAEIDFGIFEGKSWMELETNLIYRAWLDTGCEGDIPGGENRDVFQQRCVAAFRALLAEARAAGKSMLRCVVHSGTIMAILHALAEPRRPYFDWHSDFCGGYLLEDVGGARPLRLLEEIAGEKL